MKSMEGIRSSNDTITQLWQCSWESQLIAELTMKSFRQRKSMAETDTMKQYDPNIWTLQGIAMN
jgi:hypothetical protein